MWTSLAGAKRRCACYWGGPPRQGAAETDAVWQPGTPQVPPHQQQPVSVRCASVKIWACPCGLPTVLAPAIHKQRSYYHQCQDLAGWHQQLEPAEKWPQLDDGTRNCPSWRLTSNQLWFSQKTWKEEAESKRAGQRSMLKRLWGWGWRLDIVLDVNHQEWTTKRKAGLTHLQQMESSGLRKN